MSPGEGRSGGVELDKLSILAKEKVDVDCRRVMIGVPRERKLSWVATEMFVTRICAPVDSNNFIEAEAEGCQDTGH